jgi:CII-binding regulator of phage lambda lysogenization HflD
MSFLREILRAALAPDALAPQAPQAPQIQREPGAHKLSDLTLERHHAAVAADLSTLRGDLHNIAEDMRELRQRTEQVFSWLANLQTDLYKALRQETSAIVEGQAARRILTQQRGASGVPAVNPMDGGSVHPLMRDEGEAG